MTDEKDLRCEHGWPTDRCPYRPVGTSLPCGVYRCWACGEGVANLTEHVCSARAFPPAEETP